MSQDQTASEVRAPDQTALLRLVLTMAPSFQGGHSDTGADVAAVLGIPFPLRMDSLAKAAKALGFRPDDLWPWWAKMRKEREAINAG